VNKKLASKDEYGTVPAMNRILFSLPLFGLLILTGCGKVTQVSSKTPEAVTFDLKFSTQLISTSDADYKTASTNYFTTADTPLFTVIYGIGKNGKNQELSWGKALLTFKTATSTGNTAKVTALRKGDIELDAADYTWSKLSYDMANKTWNTDAKKIKLGYPLYIAAVFNSKGRAYLTILDAKRVSGNTSLTLSALTPYETFISTLVLQDLQEQKGVAEATATSGELKAFFSEDWFDLIQYQMPVTTATKFNPESPSFVYARELEKRLLAVYGLFKQNESDEALSLIEKYRKDPTHWVGAKADATLVAKLKLAKP